MNDKNLRAEELANKLFNKTITPEEEQELNSWYNRHLDDQVEIPHGFAASEEEHRARILEAINEGIGRRRVVRLWPRIAVAASRSKFGTLLITAAAVAAIVVGVYFFNNDSGVPKVNSVLNAAVNDIAPGKNGATITLANGKVIQLSDAKSGVVIGDDLKYNDGTAISGRHPELVSEPAPTGRRPRNRESIMLTASTARGQTYQFTLPDGTKVWLNADSKLEFPSSFVKSNTRNVKLVGEGYFEVAKDKTHPFIVETDKQEVEVLGTHFNINSYTDEASVKTTLLEGSVSVRHAEFISASRNGKTALQGRGPDLRQDDDRFKQGGETVILKPKQQAVITAGAVKVRDVDTEFAVAWKNGLFKFDDTELSIIMRQIGRWYDLDVIYEGKPAARTFNGLIRRDVNLSQILKVLELGGIKFRIEDPLTSGGHKRIVVMQ